MPGPCGLSPQPPTFAQATERVVALQSQSWREGAKTADGWRFTLREYAYPSLGRKAVSAITTADVLAAVAPVWTAKPETARRVRQRIGAVMLWAVAQGYRTDNPAGASLSAVLPKAAQRTEHRKALPFAEVAGALATIRASAAVDGNEGGVHLPGGHGGKVRRGPGGNLGRGRHGRRCVDDTGLPNEGRT